MKEYKKENSLNIHTLLTHQTSHQMLIIAAKIWGVSTS